MKKTLIEIPPVREYCWLIPSSIDLEKILKNHPPQFKFKPKLDYFYHIIDAICRSMDYLDPKEEHWVRLSSKNLQEFNDEYAPYLRYLEERGIIRISAYYKPGVKCKGYKLNPWLLTGDPIEIPVSSTDKVIKKKVKALLRAKAEKHLADSHDYLHLNKWFNENLTIDVKSAGKATVLLYHELETNAIKWKERLAAKRGRHKTLRAIKRMEKRDYFHHCDQNIGRYHTNLTNTKKEIRNFITYNEQMLVNCDIKNSQPLLAAIFLNSRFYKPEENYPINSSNNLLHSTNKSNKTKNTLNKILYYIMLGEIPESEEGKEFELFRNIVQGGRFYEELFTLIHPNKPFTQMDKKRMKNIVFMLMFSDNRKGPMARKQEKPFKYAFPTVYKIFSLLKRHDKRILSNVLQRTESLIIIETVSRRIAAERPDLPIFTIHDSIATTIGNEEYVMNVMNEEIKRITGLNASIGKEFWTPPCSNLSVAGDITSSKADVGFTGSGASGQAA